MRIIGIPIMAKVLPTGRGVGKAWERKVITTSKKLKKLILEEERTVEKIAELQAFLKEIREARKREEDAEILKSIRGLKLGARDLFDLFF
jgi:adenylosuccinate synthase